MSRWLCCLLGLTGLWWSVELDGADLVASQTALRSASVRTRSVVQDCQLGKACWMRTQWGSGTVVGRWRGKWAVLTCYHTLFRSGTHTVDGGDGVRYPAELIAAEPRDDLAVLVFTAERWGCVPLAQQAPTRGEWLWQAGFPGGAEYRQRTVQALGCSGTRGDLLLGQESQMGESGGGIISQGGLVGVLWGTDSRAQESLAVSLERVQEFLRRRNVQLEPCEAAPTDPRPGTPPSAPPQPAPTDAIPPPVVGPKPPATDACAGLLIEVQQLRARMGLLERSGRESLQRLEREIQELQQRPITNEAALRREIAGLRKQLHDWQTSIIVEIEALP